MAVPSQDEREEPEPTGIGLIIGAAVGLVIGGAVAGPLGAAVGGVIASMAGHFVEHVDMRRKELEEAF